MTEIEKLKIELANLIIEISRTTYEEFESKIHFYEFQRDVLLNKIEVLDNAIPSVKL